MQQNCHLFFTVSVVKILRKNVENVTTSSYLKVFNERLLVAASTMKISISNTPQNMFEESLGFSSRIASEEVL